MLPYSPRVAVLVVTFPITVKVVDAAVVIVDSLNPVLPDALTEAADGLTETVIVVCGSVSVEASDESVANPRYVAVAAGLATSIGDLNLTLHEPIGKTMVSVKEFQLVFPVVVLSFELVAVTVHFAGSLGNPSGACSPVYELVPSVSFGIP